MLYCFNHSLGVDECIDPNQTFIMQMNYGRSALRAFLSCSLNE